jgi:glutamate 5-kinase
MEKVSHIDVIKYGTAVLTNQDFDGAPAIDHNIMKQHGKVIQAHIGPKILISSGAVGFGRVAMNGHDFKNEDETTVKRILAELGQPDLIEAWKQAMPHEKVLQKLVTYYDLKRKTVKETVQAAVANQLLYVFNFNDGVDDSELKEDAKHEFGDNDHLASQVAGFSTAIADNVRLILNTSADGFKLKNTNKALTQLDASEINQDFVDLHCEGTSNGGTGGMGDKLLNAKKALELGAKEVWIIHGKKPAQLQTVLAGGPAGTKITKSPNVTEI